MLRDNAESKGDSRLKEYRLSKAGWASDFPELPERPTAGLEWSLTIRDTVVLVALSILYVRMLQPAPSGVLPGLSPAYAQ
jgi:hypothetical protein